jgi:hypothetical protein
MAEINRPPPIDLVASILIGNFFDRNRGKFKPSAAAQAFVTTGAVC